MAALVRPSEDPGERCEDYLAACCCPRARPARAAFYELKYVAHPVHLCPAAAAGSSSTAFKFHRPRARCRWWHDHVSRKVLYSCTRYMYSTAICPQVAGPPAVSSSSKKVGRVELCSIRRRGTDDGRMPSLMQIYKYLTNFIGYI